MTKPLLFVDVDGVISLFGFREGYGLAAGDAPFATALPAAALDQRRPALHILRVRRAPAAARRSAIELVWATGWEETANDYLPHLLGLPGELPCLTFDGRVAAGTAHWKVDAIAEYAGPTARSPGSTTTSTSRCHDWAARRPAPTLLVETLRHEGMGEEHVESCCWRLGSEA